MKTIKKKIEELKINPDNTRTHGKVQIKEFIRSIQQFGVIRPIVADENGVILCGNGLYEALKEMGKTEVDVLIKEGLTEKEKKKLLLADNKIFALGVDNFDAIDNLLQSLNGDFDIPGYDADDLESLYGQSSLEDVKDVKYDVPKIEPKNVSFNKVEQEYTRSEKVPSEAKEGVCVENKRFIICPHCGEKIEL